MKMIWVSFCCHRFQQLVSWRCRAIPSTSKIFFILLSDAADLKPIALPLINIIAPRLNEEGTVSAFGIVEDLVKPAPNEDMKTTFLTVISESECPINNFSAQAGSNFCALDQLFNTRLCRGDVGSAFIVLQRGIPTLVCILHSEENTEENSKN